MPERSVPVIPMINRSRMAMPRRSGWFTARAGSRWKTLGAIGTLLLVAACSDGPTGPSIPPTPVGTFVLNTIESKALPYAMFADSGYKLEITSGTLAITVNGKWVSKITSRETVVGFASTYIDSSFGTWTVPSGATTAVLINTETNITSNATWTASDVTVNEVDGTIARKIVYRRN